MKSNNFFDINNLKVENVFKYPFKPVSAAKKKQYDRNKQDVVLGDQNNYFFIACSVIHKHEAGPARHETYRRSF